MLVQVKAKWACTDAVVTCQGLHLSAIITLNNGEIAMSKARAITSNVQVQVQVQHNHQIVISRK